VIGVGEPLGRSMKIGPVSVGLADAVGSGGGVTIGVEGSGVGGMIWSGPGGATPGIRRVALGLGAGLAPGDWVASGGGSGFVEVPGSPEPPPLVSVGAGLGDSAPGEAAAGDGAGDGDGDGVAAWATSCCSNCGGAASFTPGGGVPTTGIASASIWRTAAISACRSLVAGAPPQVRFMRAITRGSVCGAADASAASGPHQFETMLSSSATAQARRGRARRARELSAPRDGTGLPRPPP
jgi:hypothetical protein